MSYSPSSRGHCETISKFGMGLSLVGARFAEAELARIGRLLLVRVALPDSTIEAVVSILNHRRLGEKSKRKWLLGVSLYQITDEDTVLLEAYLDLRAKSDRLIIPH